MKKKIMKITIWSKQQQQQNDGKKYNLRKTNYIKYYISY